MFSRTREAHDNTIPKNPKRNPKNLFEQALDELKEKVKSNINQKSIDSQAKLVTFGSQQPIDKREYTLYEYFLDLEKNEFGRKIIEYTDEKGLAEAGTEYFKDMRGRGDQSRFLSGVIKACKELEKANKKLHKDDSFQDY